MAKGDLQGAIDIASRVLVDLPSSAAAQNLIAEARRQQEARLEPARVGIQFDCPISRGNLVLSVDGEEVETIDWDFSRKVAFGLRRGGRGEVTGSVQVAPGSHEVAIRIISSKRGVVGEHLFEQAFEPDSQ